MYYESRINTLTDITDFPIEIQAKKVKSLGIGSAVQIKQIIFVNDANPSGCGISEVAVIYERDNNFYAFESLTVDRIHIEEMSHLITQYCNSSFEDIKKSLFASKTSFNNIEKEVYFNCGCCGEGFKSTISKQEKFDQDSGFGLCDECSIGW